MNQPKIFVIGDYIEDEFIYGSCDRISPEAPVPVMKPEKIITTPGGAGNVMENLKSLGADVNCWFGNKINSHKTRVICNGQHVVRIDDDNVVEIMPPDDLGDRMDWADIILICDYGKGIVNKTLIAELTRLYQFSNLRVKPLRIVVDPYMNRFDYGPYVYLIKPNLKELKSVVGSNEQSFVLEEAKQYLAKSLSKYLLVTCGKEGMILIDGGRYDNLPFVVLAEAKQVYDVTGAGDTAIAVMAYILSQPRHSIQSAVRWANKACGIVVEKLGTATVTFEELFGPYLKEFV